MAKLLQIEFPYAGPFGADMAKAFSELARSIAEEPGLLWKIWTENKEAGLAGGVYLFADDESARSYLQKHTNRLKELGIDAIRANIFDINNDLTKITRGPIA